MAQVTLKINGYAYNVGCQDGEEPHLLAMAEQIEERVTRAKALGPQSGEARLLVMAALFMADELHDLRLEMKAGAKGKTPAAEKASQERLKKLAARAEAIASATEQH
jgi:cell division protein ZapA